MAKQSRNFSWEVDLKKFINGVSKIYDQLGVDNPTNALRKICALQSKITEKEVTLNEYLTLTNTTTHGNAKQRILSLMRKAGGGNSVVEKYGLDTSFLKGVGTRWDKTTEGKDQIQMVEYLNKRIARQRNIVEEYYYRFLDRVALYCEKEQMNEGETQEQVERWHTAMVEDFDLLTAGEFFEKYYGDSHDLTVFPKENESVLLVDALPLVREYAPARLYQELIIETEILGYVTRHTFNAWDKIAAGVTQMPHKEAVKTMRELMMKVIGTAAYRSIKGPESLPNLGVESNTLVMLLAHPDDNPYSREFAVSDDTSLLEFVKNYLEFSQV